MAAKNYETAISLIDEAHAQDPKIKIVNGEDVPYELFYAQQMTKYLNLRAPNASPILKVAIRAQHFRRWEIPRDSYPLGKPGYFKWRTFLKKRQGDLAAAICLGCNFTNEEAEEVARLIRKEDLKSNEETQILEDVACLVFLDDQFEAFKTEHDEAKIIDILVKSLKKMSKEGITLAAKIDMSEKSQVLIGKAVEELGRRGGGERDDVKMS
jgi:NTP pyrophosphatase (non-canonical NTP hydrolase)